MGAYPRFAPSSDATARIGGTLTTAGFIPHLAFRGLRCPVLLETVRTRHGVQIYTDGRGVPYPRRVRGGYLFALPGGFRVEGPRSRARE